MKKDIKTTNIELTPALHAYANEKLDLLGRLLDKSDQSVYASVEIGLTTHHHHKGRVFRAEVNLHTAGRNFRAVEFAEDLYAAIDLVKDELARELRSHKEKSETLFRRGGRIIKNLIRFGRK